MKDLTLDALELNDFSFNKMRLHLCNMLLWLKQDGWDIEEYIADANEWVAHKSKGLHIHSVYRLAKSENNFYRRLEKRAAEKGVDTIEILKTGYVNPNINRNVDLLIASDFIPPGSYAAKIDDGKVSEGAILPDMRRSMNFKTLTIAISDKLRDKQAQQYYDYCNQDINVTNPTKYKDEKMNWTNHADKTEQARKDAQLLMNEGAFTVRVSFDAIGGEEYTYRSTFRPNVGDVVVVPNSGAYVAGPFALAYVRNVSEVEPEAGKYKWLVCPVDHNAYDVLLEREEFLYNELLASTVKAERDEARAKLRERIGAIPSKAEEAPLVRPADYQEEFPIVPAGYGINGLDKSESPCG